MITVGELIERLQTMPHDRGVVLSVDAEGNRFTPVVDVSTVFWDQDPRHAWIGEVWSDDPDDYPPDEDMPRDLPTVAVIEPLN
jgi:hypothetical protein